LGDVSMESGQRALIEGSGRRTQKFGRAFGPEQRNPADPKFQTAIISAWLASQDSSSARERPTDSSSARERVRSLPRTHFFDFAGACRSSRRR
jgi:hypothetical protein